MGGNAFQSKLSTKAIPRLPPTVYYSLKTRIQPILDKLYLYVGVPKEAPEKKDFGDLDFVVYSPRLRFQGTGTRPPGLQFANASGRVRVQESESQATTTTTQNLNLGSGLSINPAIGTGTGTGNPKVELEEEDKDEVSVPHELVKEALGAKHVIAMMGNRVSNFAIPIMKGEWKKFGSQLEEEELQRRREVEVEVEAGAEGAEGSDGGIYFQVDVSVCETEEEWENKLFFHSYGDLNIILGLIVKNSGLHLSHKGLKLPDPGHPAFELSTSFTDIFSFYEWPMNIWQKGFQTHEECYEFATRSVYFDPKQFKPSNHTTTNNLNSKTRKQHSRSMYSGFFEWVVSNANDTKGKEKEEDAKIVIRERALDFFHKREKFEALVLERLKKEVIKNTFRGSTIRDWTSLGNYWVGVKKIMDGTRERLGGDEKIELLLLEDNGVEKLKKVVLEVQEELQIYSLQVKEEKEKEVVSGIKVLTI